MKTKYAVMVAMLFLISILVCLCQADDSAPVTKFGYTDKSDEEQIFMHLRRSLTSKLSPDELQKAKFGIAEYYFRHHDLSDAFRAFKEYADSYPPETSTLLAKVYLYKIANIKAEPETANSLKKEIFANSFVLLFSKFKVLKYLSAFDNRYEIHYYLDKIQVFLNGGNFEEITP